MERNNRESAVSLSKALVAEAAIVSIDQLREDTSCEVEGEAQE